MRLLLLLLCFYQANSFVRQFSLPSTLRLHQLRRCREHEHLAINAFRRRPLLRPLTALRYDPPEPPQSRAPNFLGNWPFATAQEVEKARRTGETEFDRVNEPRSQSEEEKDSFYELEETMDGFEPAPYGDHSRVVYDPSKDEFSYIDARASAAELLRKLGADLVDDEKDEEEQERERLAKKPFLVTYTLRELRERWEAMKTQSKTTSRKKKKGKAAGKDKATQSEGSEQEEERAREEEGGGEESGAPRYDLVIQSLLRANTTLQIVDDEDEHCESTTSSSTPSHHTGSDEKSGCDPDDKDGDSLTDGVTYVTEQELRRLWLQHCIRNERRLSSEDEAEPVSSFDMQRALLTVRDELDELLCPEDEESLFSKVQLPPARRTVKKVEEKIINGHSVLWEEEEVEIDDSKNELFITEQELRRVWEERSVFDLRMPKEAFNESLSLLLVDPHSEDAQDLFDPGRNAYEQALMNDEDDGDPLIERYPHMDPDSDEYRELRAAFDEIHDDLDDFEEDMQSWPLSVRSMSPSIEVQHTPDVMRSLPKTWRKLPMNYGNDLTNTYRAKYGERFAQAYEATATMNLDDTDDSDFENELEERTLSSFMGLPFGPDFDNEETANELCPLSPNGTLWADSGGPDYWPEISPHMLDDRLQDFERIIEIPNLRRPLSEFDHDIGNTPEMRETEEFIERLEQNERVDNVLYRSNRIIAINASVNDIVNGLKQTFVPDWSCVETFDVSRIALKEFVYDCWERFEREKNSTEDDHFDYSDIFHTIQTVNATLYATSNFLLDYQEFDRRIDDERALKRFVTAKMLNHSVEFPVQEPIPDELMPDKDRGIRYTDEIIEMKNYKSLLPAEDPDAFKDDIFTPNENVRPVNMIGTIRHQYDWEPDLSLMPYVIEPEKLERIGPLIRFINYAARLKSTKNNVLVFEFLGGRTRHIIGLRATLLQLARKHCPEIRDVRLETEDLFDSTDVNY